MCDDDKKCKCGAGQCSGCLCSDIGLEDLTFRAPVSGQTSPEDQKYQQVSQAFRLLAEKHGGTARFGMSGNGNNSVEFDIPEENKQAFDDELIELVSSMDGMEVV